MTLDGCRQAGLIISHKKLKMGSEVFFGGYIINSEGVQPNPEKVEGIAKFPAPTNVSELRSFLGLVNTFDIFHPDLAHAKATLNQLLRKNIAWLWLEDHQKSFDDIKDLLSKEMKLYHYDPNLRTELLTDASRLKGLGFALTQMDESGKLRLVAASSRSLTSAESNYAVCELEALAIQWAIKKCHHYLCGGPRFKVLTDHRPLVGIFKKHMDDVENTRLQRILIKTQSYNFDVEYTPGKTHLVADALSRAPVFSPPEEEPFGVTTSAVSSQKALAEDCEVCVCYQICPHEDDLSAKTLHGVNKAMAKTIGLDYNLLDLIEKAKEDKDYQLIVKAFKEGFDPKNLPQSHPAREFASKWGDISLFDEHPLLVYEGHRIIVPKSCRKEILDLLHKPHIGQVGTKTNARQLYFWPGITNDIKLMCESCEPCRRHLASRPKEPLQQTVAEYPFQMLSADLWETAGQHFLITCDRYSGFPWVDKLNKLNTQAVANKMLTRFRDYGFLPQSIRVDNGPQFRTEFEEFCGTFSIEYVPCAPYNSQSNGHAESTVATVKHLLNKCGGKFNDDYHARLAELRNCPRPDGYSPAQMLYQRRLKGLLPVLPSAYQTIDVLHAELQRQRKQDYNKAYVDSRAHPIKEMTEGTPVVIQDTKSLRWEIEGTVLASFQSGRCLKIRLNNGKVYFRNRRHVRVRPE